MSADQYPKNADHYAKISFRGKLIVDPDLREVGTSRHVVTLFAACDAGGKKAPSMSFVMWGKTGDDNDEALQKFQSLKKFDEVLIEARLGMDSWADKTTGQKRTKHLGSIESITVMESASAPAEADGGEPVEEDDIPF